MKRPPNHHVAALVATLDNTLADAADAYGTPLFFYSAEQLEADWAALRRALPDPVEIFYSVKANPSLAVIDVFAGLGAGFEVSSLGEALAVHRVGAAMERTVFVGPGKSEEDILAALRLGVGLIAVESKTELLLLESVAASCRSSCRALLRVNPGAGYGDMRMSGATQFGMDPVAAINLLKEREHFPHVSIVGFHSFMGTRLLDWHKLAGNFEAVLEAADVVAAASDYFPETIDLGGGLGVALHEGDEPLDIDALGEVLADMVESFGKSHPSVRRYVVEVGRYLVARAGVLVTRVLDVKETAGSLFVIVDGGINAVGGRETLIGGKIVPIKVLGGNHGGEVELTVCGPLCTPADRIAARVVMPKPRRGDLLAVYNAGAYCLTASPGLFLSRGFPGEAMARGGRLKLVRRPFGPEKLLAGQSLFQIDVTSGGVQFCGRPQEEENGV